MTREDHMVMVKNQFRCLRCEATEALEMPIEIGTFGAKSKAFRKAHRACEKPASRVNCAFCRKNGHDHMACPTIDTLEKWYEHGLDCGESSTAIFLQATGQKRSGAKEHPLDPSDFGRCYRLIERFPEARFGIDRLAALDKVWERMNEAWAELEALYREEVKSGNAPKLYARMQELRGVKR